MRVRLVHIAAALLLAAGCDSFGPLESSPDVVVEAYLVAGEPLAGVRLTQSVPIDEPFDEVSAGVWNADVRIELLDEGGRVEESFPYRLDPSGRYVLDTRKLSEEGRDPQPLVRPLRTYRLVADAASGTISSVTTVPDTFRVVSVSSDVVVYRSNEPLRVFVSRSAYPGRQSVFILTTTALEPHVDELTPFARSVYENGDVTITELSENASPLLNEENFERTADGTLRVQYPWLGVNFYGRNVVTFRAIDDNLFDFVRSHNVQQGGSTLPPGEIPNVLEHVSGGRGIFGSVAETSVVFVVLRGADDAN